MRVQLFALLLLFAVSVTGLMLTLSNMFMAGKFYYWITTTHAVTVMLWLLFLHTLLALHFLVFLHFVFGILLCLRLPLSSLW